MKYIFMILLLISASLGYGQNNVFVAQYYKVMPVYAPGLTGAKGFLDIKAGTKSTWQGYDGGSGSYFFSANGILMKSGKSGHKHNSMHVSDMSSYDDRVVKIGLGGYLISDRFGVTQQVEGAISQAVHVLVSQDTHLSLGTSVGRSSAQIDVLDLTVRDPANDVTYHNYLNSGYEKISLKLDFGLSVYSDQYYFSYSMMNLYPNRSKQYLGSTARETAHHIIGGYNFLLDSKFEVIPNFHARKASGSSFLLDLGGRVRYRQNAYAGISYRTNQSIIFLFGYTVNDMLDIGYSFESIVLNSTLSNTGSHEIVLGVRLFNYKKYEPMW